MTKLQHVHRPDSAHRLAARPLPLVDLFEIAPEPAVAAPTDPVFTLDELARSATAAAFSAAAEARAAARASQSERTAEAVGRIDLELSRAREAYDRSLDRLNSLLTDLVTAAFRGLAGPYAATMRYDRAHGFLRGCLVDIGGAPDVEILVPSDLAATAEAAVEEVRKRSGEATSIRVVVDPLMAPSRILVRWAGGWAEHDPDAALQELESRVRAAADLLTAEHLTAAPLDPSTGPPTGPSADAGTKLRTDQIEEHRP